MLEPHPEQTGTDLQKVGFLGCISLDHFVGIWMAIFLPIFIIVIVSLPYHQCSIGFISFPLHSTDNFLSC